MSRVIKTKLKGGKLTKDIRLDRVPFFDERSRNFSIAALGTGPLRSYTWRCNEWFDQGVEGACVAYSLGHELAARPSEVKGINDKFLKEEIYWNAQRNDPWSGGSYPGARPVYEGTSVLAGVKEVVKRGYCEEYRWAFNTYDALYSIGHNGPAVIGVTWFTGMMNPDGNGFIHPTGMIVGGHCVLVRAVNVVKRFVTIRNSWGKSWGVNGECYLSFEDFNTILQNDGECVFLMKRKTTPKV